MKEKLVKLLGFKKVNFMSEGIDYRGVQISYSYPIMKRGKGEQAEKRYIGNDKIDVFELEIGAEYKLYFNQFEMLTYLEKVI